MHILVSLKLQCKIILGKNVSAVRITYGLMKSVLQHKGVKIVKKKKFRFFLVLVIDTDYICEVLPANSQKLYIFRPDCVCGADVARKSYI